MFRRDFLPSLISYSVVLHTKDGRSVSGALTATHRDVIVLSHPHYLTEEGQRVPLDGDAVIPRENVAFVQLDGGRLA